MQISRSRAPAARSETPRHGPTVLGRQTDTARRQPIADQQQHFIKSTQLVSV
ncbi:hypothetical protein OCO_14820 [Mycobacterium intracellulare MOTT-02]|uniref:Uncharacterized protein n=1 Tax=Mycobacterium intracellulare (strain ATCC 13950 / DSM 43223 / JCM 6384 / NCTC 13025 / 3600) TaxID=487521 RepID=H8IKY6_MYCIA|nr:hypothetical protein OCU_15260 [Mycobacterium intracellulare ATCC 13950]AFC47845.1 hypothetical protein OCO_14820 [Mycobacterium intracellulare MOTT-02]ETZ38017.1 hypothetical protein L843_1731 [Mycobacterium intracellulare MIN_061107_1834]